MDTDNKEAMQKEIVRYRGPLLTTFEKATQLIWDWLLCQTAVWFQSPAYQDERRYIIRRDLFAFTTFLLSIACFLTLRLHPPLLLKVATAAAGYQILGLSFV